MLTLALILLGVCLCVMAVVCDGGDTDDAEPTLRRDMDGWPDMGGGW